MSFLPLGHSFTTEFNDDEDTINGRSNVVRYTNNYLCYFVKWHPCVQYSLFQAYCTNLYGCQLWLLTNSNIEALCIAWRKTLRRICNLPSCTHSRLLPLVCNCLPLFDELCRGSLHFIRTCSSRFVFDPFCCAVWCVICSQSVNQFLAKMFYFAHSAIIVL